MKFNESVSACCRYGELANEMWADWDLVWEKSENDYSGEVNFLINKYDEYIYCGWSYGSCRVCDTWEAQDLSNKEIKKEILNSSLIMNKQMLNEWLTRISGKLTLVDTSIKEILDGIH